MKIIIYLQSKDLNTALVLRCLNSKESDHGHQTSNSSLLEDPEY